MQLTKTIILAIAVLSYSAAHAERRADVTLEITSRSDAFGNTAFGDRGSYEQINAIAHMQIDPRTKNNRGIVDLDRAPRNADGLVSYDVDVVILRPRDAAKARRVMIYDVVNRGMKLIPMMMNHASGVNAASAGDGFLMRQGYTIVWSGWQGDIADSKLVGARFPVATERTRPITGRISTDVIFDDLKSDRIRLAYAADTLDKNNAHLTVREHADDPERSLASDDWSYEDSGHITLKRPADMDAGAIYRFSYIARDPKVMGLGFAATRDLITFLRHGTAAEGNPLADLATASCERNAAHECANPKGGAFDTTVAFGTSQSGRYLRDLVWQGFNRDLTGRRVFDGVISMIPGARRTFTNMRFSEPGRFSRQHEDHDVPGFDFPFAYSTLRDPLTGRTDGILRDCSTDGTCPKFFHVDTSSEFWQAGASLVGTGGTDRDVDFPANVRAYLIAGGAHAPGLAPPMCQHPANSLNYTPVMRALLNNMVDWTSGRSDPPASRWPRLADNQLRTIESIHAPEPTSIGITWPRVLNQPVAPGKTGNWPVLVPTVDADGTDAPGIRMPQLAAPLGTYLGWNLRKPGYAEGDLCLIYGSFIPFARDAASRGSDPRPSIAERYAEPDAIRAPIEASVAALRKDRLILDEDAASLLSSGNR